MDKTELKILQLNIQSLNQNKDELEYILNKDKIDIAILSETWTRKERKIKMKNHIIYTNDREDHYGGVGFIIKKYLNASNQHLNQYHPIEATKLELQKDQKETITIIGLYIPPEYHAEEVNEKIKKIIRDHERIKNLIIAGDINAHHPCWEKDHEPDRRGNLIAETIINSKMLILNNGDHTWIGNYRQRSSAIDITLVNPELLRKTTWEVQQIKIGGTGHIPIIISIDEATIKNKTYNTKINWQNTNMEIENLNSNHTFDIIDYEEEITGIIENNTITIPINNRYISKPWWNEKIDRLWKIKREKQKLYNKKKTEYTENELKRATGKLKIEIKKEKRKSWNNFIKDITPEMTTKQIWAKINIFNNKRENPHSNIFINEETMQSFINRNIIQSKTEENDQLRLPRGYPLENEFTFEEITDIIKNSKNSAPGLNKISNKILKGLPKSHIQTITNHINKLWKEQNYPEKWKEIKLVAIKKPGKDYKDVNNYRGIHLIPTVAKIINKLVKNRIIGDMERQEILPKYSFGFRKGKSCSDYITTMIKIIEQNKKENLMTIAIITDIEKAFDKVHTNTLIKILEKKGVKQVYINWIYKYLINRKIIFTKNNITIEAITSNSLPQGDPLSPDLFNIYTANLHKITKDKVTLLQYADDMTIIISGTNKEELNKNANEAIEAFNKKLKKIKLTMNLDKTKYIDFSKQKRNKNINIKVNNQEIKEEKLVTILGYHLDNKLNLNKHHEIVKQKCQGALNIIKNLARAHGGTHPTILLNLHKSLIESRIRLSSILTSNKKHIENIQKIHNTSLRTCLGLTKSTPVTAIIAEAGEIPAHLKTEIYKATYIAKQIARNTEMGKDIINNKSTANIQSTYNNPEYQLKQIARNHSTRNNNHNNAQQNIEVDLSLYNSIQNKSKFNKQELLQMTLEKLSTISNNNRIYTDGAIINNNRGIGIYNERVNEMYCHNIRQPISIKSLETIAIKLAIEKAIEKGQNNLIILTDSKNSCTSLINTLNQKNEKYYEMSIINIIKEYNIMVKIIWIPGHIDLKGNECADQAAKIGTTKNEQLQIKIPIEEYKQLIKQVMYEKWGEEFRLRTETKGIQHARNINHKPKMKPWFHKQKLEAGIITTLTRIRTNHTYDRKFLKLIKLETNDICQICKTQENHEHIISNCQKYNNIRDKYRELKESSLEEIIKSEDMEKYKIIHKFLKEIDIYI